MHTPTASPLSTLHLARVLDSHDTGCTLQLLPDPRITTAHYSEALRRRGIVVRPGHLVVTNEASSPQHPPANTFEVIWRGPSVVRLTSIDGHQATFEYEASAGPARTVTMTVVDARPIEERQPLQPGQQIVIFPVERDPEAVTLVDLATDGLPLHLDRVASHCFDRAARVRSSSPPAPGAHHPATDVDPRRVVADGYDRMAERYAAWLAHDVVDEARPRYLAHLLERLPAGARVLELGCGGGGPTTQQLAARFSVTGLDISSRQIALARANVPTAHFIHADMTTAEFPSESFVAIVSFYALGHLPYGALPVLLRKIATWLRPNGLFVATAAGADPGTLEPSWLGVPMYFSGYAPQDTRRFVEDAGLVVEVLREEPIIEDGHPTSFRWLIAHRPPP